MDLHLTNKKALVTGSTAGIGLAIATSLLKEGAAVIINGRSETRIGQAIAGLQKAIPGCNVTGIVADFSNVQQVDELIKKAGDIDILINNIGIFEPKQFFDIPDKDWFNFFEVNVLSGVRLSRAFMPYMLQQNWGRIIFISSESGVLTPGEMIHYGTTKTAQLAVSRGLAELTKGSAVTVNTVLPGPTWSEGASEFVKNLAQSQQLPVEQVEASFFKEERPTSLLQRFATVNEVASMVTYLVSPLASATNGAAVRVDGGVVKHIL
jgi:NAD(P)-dependent dehydrogenase (short-subunit alcohol dehydrogenase family)